ncbi:glycosyltransferase family 4 protein [Jeotgalibacillus proteolyticus]|uniref:Glycosyltransferase family 1 protein n=1 Tax=Jeotgalibacillus proteolyticus TaxID=2082395 RepID=A0A2S5GB33_9BACL|nr:glycosyltransferase family 4 protein [Jeotgalibacillus proteolyticus]PPA70135.1 glycosyltransferase family 1 protein [Jeotgalibacillus proteolyticus]
MKRRILFVTTISRTAEAFLLPHIRYFLDRGFAVGVAANMDDGSIDQLKALGVCLHHVPFSRSLFHPGNIKAFFKIRSVSKNYSILHLHTPIASFLTRMAALKQHITIYTAHGFHFNEQEGFIKNAIFKLVEKIASYKTSKLVVTNTDDLKAAKELFKNTSISHVHGVGVDTDIFFPKKTTPGEKAFLKQQLGILPDKKVITHIAELNENKRQIDVIEACEKLKKSRSDFVFLLIGKGDKKEELEKEIKERGLENEVKCLGFVRDIPSILSITDIGLLVSLREGLPRSLMEMMAMEVPVIATDIRGIRDLVVNGHNGFLIPVKSPSRLSEYCSILLKFPAIAKRFGKQGRKKVNQHYALPIILQEMEAVYNELLEDLEE